MLQFAKKNKKKVLFTVIVVGLFVLFNCFFRIWMIAGESMLPTLTAGELRLSYKPKAYNRGDIIALESSTKETYIKRIIAVPNDTISIKQGVVYVNGKEVTEKYIASEYKSNETIAELKLSEGEYFVMGDNRKNSYDSRKFGAITKDTIYGKIFAEY